MPVSAPTRKSSFRANSIHAGKTCPRCAKQIVATDTVETIRTADGPTVAHSKCKSVPRRRRKKQNAEQKQNPAPGAATEIPSRYATAKCKKCGKGIGFGEMITNAEIEQYGWIHATCATPVDASKVETVDPATLSPNVEAKPAPATSEPATPATPSPTAPTTTNVESELIGRLVAALNKAGRSIAVLDKRVKQLEAMENRVVEIRSPDDTRREIDGVVHPIFERVLQLASMRKNVLIPGPTGCGKTHLAQQVADALDLPFGFISCSGGMSEGQLTGRLLPIGDGGKFEFVGTEFLECFENGGVFLLDEMDAADSNVLLVINAALANGLVPVPNRPAQPYARKHDDFVLIAGTNTDGTGADRQYAGRNQLDDATLDRFRIGQVAMDYDATIEAKLLGASVEVDDATPHDVDATPATAQEIFDTLTRYRDRIKSARLERNISTRFLLDARDMATGCGWSMADIETALFSGWRDDEVSRVKTTA